MLNYKYGSLVSSKVLNLNLGGLRALWVFSVTRTCWSVLADRGWKDVSCGGGGGGGCVYLTGSGVRGEGV